MLRALIGVLVFFWLTPLWAAEPSLGEVRSSIDGLKVKQAEIMGSSLPGDQKAKMNGFYQTMIREMEKKLEQRQKEGEGK